MYDISALFVGCLCRLFPCSFNLLSSVYADIDEFLHYLLTHTTTGYTQLLPLSVLLHIVNNSCSSESSSVLLATKELIFPIIYSYSCNLLNISDISTTDNTSLCQYRSAVTEYCLDKLCCKLQSSVKLLPTDDHVMTLSNRQQHCQELEQLLNYLWSISCTPLISHDHYQ